MLKNYATIVIDKETRVTLRNFGRKSQTYDDIIRELIEQKRKNGSPSSGQLRETRRL